MEDRFKFRLWDTSHHAYMIYFGSEFALDDDEDTATFKTEGNSIVIGDHNFHGDRFIRMQCTGLKDKKKKLCFESDIIRRDNHGHITLGFVFFNEKYSCLMWCEQKFYGEQNDGSGHGDYLDKLTFSSNIGFEIIGNIHENGDLLNKL